MLQALYNAIRADVAPVITNVDGRTYTSKEIYPVRIPTPLPIEVKTLTGMVDYIMSKIDEAYPVDSLLCHVESPDTVRLYAPLTDDFKYRPLLMKARMDIIQLPIGEIVEADKFNVLLQSCFYDTDNTTDLATVLKCTSSVMDVMANTLTDDGITQTVTRKSGITTLSRDKMPNPVLLQPYRTFVEVKQPASKFVLRVKKINDCIHFMLIEADGGAWKNEAMENVKKYMLENVPGLHVIA